MRANRIRMITRLVVRVVICIRRGVATVGCRAVRRPQMALGAVTRRGIMPAPRIHTLTILLGITVPVTTRQGITVLGITVLGITVLGIILLATTRRVTIVLGIIRRGCCVVVPSVVS